MLDEWDPIGVYVDFNDDDGEVEDETDGPLPGEYSDLVWPIMKMLDAGEDAMGVARGIRHVMGRDYGMPGVQAYSFAERVVAWHVSRHE